MGDCILIEKGRRKLSIKVFYPLGYKQSRLVLNQKGLNCRTCTITEKGFGLEVLVLLIFTLRICDLHQILSVILLEFVIL